MTKYDETKVAFFKNQTEIFFDKAGQAQHNLPKLKFPSCVSNLVLHVLFTDLLTLN